MRNTNLMDEHEEAQQSELGGGAMPNPGGEELDRAFGGLGLKNG